MTDSAAVRAVRLTKAFGRPSSRRLFGALIVVAALLGFGGPAAASPVLVGFSSSGFGPITFGADTFSMTGGAGSLTLDDELETTRTINTAVFTVGNSGSLSATQNLILTHTLILAGISHTLTQAATWTITPTQDTFIAVDASGPVLFDTAAGDWLVTLNAFSFATGTLGTQTRSVTADFAPTSVPEPASIVLFGTGALGLIANLRRRRQQG